MRICELVAIRLPVRNNLILGQEIVLSKIMVWIGFLVCQMFVETKKVQ